MLDAGTYRQPECIFITEDELAAMSTEELRLLERMLREVPHNGEAIAYREDFHSRVVVKIRPKTPCITVLR